MLSSILEKKVSKKKSLVATTVAAIQNFNKITYLFKKLLRNIVKIPYLEKFWHFPLTILTLFMPGFSGVF